MFYLMGWGEMGSNGMGSDGYSKCPIFFVILRYIKHYIHNHIYKYKKCPENFLVCFKFGQVGGLDEKIENTLFYKVSK